MEITVTRLPSLFLWGRSIVCPQDSDEIESLWNDVNQLAGLCYDKTVTTYGIKTRLPEESKNEVNYYAGFPIPQHEPLISDIETRTLTETYYAVFKLEGSLSGLKQLYRDIFERWLPGSEYAPYSDYTLEVFDKDFKGFSPDSVMYVYVPIKGRA